jgi:TolA-binding protein
VGIALVLATAGGCVYFNRMYNAKRAFKQAENSPRGKDDRITPNQRQAYNDTVERCQKVLASHPDSRWADDALYMYAVSKLRLGDYEESVELFQELLEKYPDSGFREKALFHLAEAQLADGEPDWAVKTLDRFRSKYQKSDLYDRVYLLQGDILFEKEEYERCIEAYRLLLQKYPDSKARVEARRRIGESERARGNFEASLQEYRKVLDEDLNEGQVFEARRTVAQNLADLGRHEEALEEYALLDEEATDLRTYMSALIGRAQSEVGVAQYDSALATLTTVTRKVPRSELAARAYYDMGKIYRDRLEDLDKAVEMFDMVGKQYRRGDLPFQALKASNDIQQMKKLRATLETAEGDTTAEAKEALAEAQFLLAEVSLEQYDDPNRALGEYQKVLDQFPDSPFAPRAAYAIAWIYHNRLDRKDKALEALDFLTSHYPESVQAETAETYLFEGESP